jgi:hypothetical protein
MTSAETFDTNLLRLIAAELYFLLGMQTARELLGKSYFALGANEKVVVDQAVLAQVGGKLCGHNSCVADGSASAATSGLPSPPKRATASRPDTIFGGRSQAMTPSQCARLTDLSAPVVQKGPANRAPETQAL